MENIKKQAFSPPNILSYIRILLIPAFVCLYLQKRYIAAAALVALSGLTDTADGYIARKYNMITEWGKILDPVADKLTQGALLLCLLSRYNRMWILAMLFAVKELTMALLGLFSLFIKKKKLSGAKWYGKVSTVVQFVAMTVLFAFSLPEKAVDIIIWVCAAFMLLAFFMYMREYRKMLKEKPQGQDI